MVVVYVCPGAGRRQGRGCQSCIFWNKTRSKQKSTIPPRLLISDRGNNCVCQNAAEVVIFTVEPEEKIRTIPPRLLIKDRGNKIVCQSAAEVVIFTVEPEAPQKNYTPDWWSRIPLAREENFVCQIGRGKNFVWNILLIYISNIIYNSNILVTYFNNITNLTNILVIYH